MIPYGRQSVDEGDIAAVTEVLRGDWLTQGPHVEQFEGALAAVTDARAAVAFSSGTAALHAAVVIAGLGPGDRVATSPLSFAASAACALYAGAEPCFVDIDPATLNIDLRLLPPGLAGAVVVHFAGLPAALDFGDNRPRVVIEDAAHALGARTPDGPVGNCARSDMCVFSFHPVKAITTGEGGAVTTNDPELAERLRRFRSHGAVRQPERGGWYYEIPDLGYNYRITDLQAALGRSQLQRLDAFVERRNELARQYDDLLAGVGLVRPPQSPAGTRHGYHLYPIQVNDRRQVYDRMRALGVGVQVHYIPIYRHPLYAPFGSPSDFPATEAAYERLLSLPVYPDLSDKEQSVVVDALKAVL